MTYTPPPFTRISFRRNSLAGWEQGKVAMEETELRDFITERPQDSNGRVRIPLRNGYDHGTNWITVEEIHIPSALLTWTAENGWREANTTPA